MSTFCLTVNMSALQKSYSFVMPPDVTRLTPEFTRTGHYTFSNINRCSVNFLLVGNSTFDPKDWLSCWYCRTSFQAGEVVGGLPYEFQPSQKQSKEYSTILDRDRIILTDAETSEVSNNSTNYLCREIFKTDGYMCSLNCVEAWRKELEQLKNPKYKDSEGLVKYLASLLGYDGDVSPSPDWRLLVHNGGPMSVSEYFKSINTIRFKVQEGMNIAPTAIFVHATTSV